MHLYRIVYRYFALGDQIQDTTNMLWLRLKWSNGMTNRLNFDDVFSLSAKSTKGIHIFGKTEIIAKGERNLKKTSKEKRAWMNTRNMIKEYVSEMFHIEKYWILIPLYGKSIANNHIQKKRKKKWKPQTNFLNYIGLSLP